MNFLSKTAIDTIATTGVVAPVIYEQPAQQAYEHIINGGDFKAPLIALASSVIVQLTLKAFRWFNTKILKNEKTA